MSFRSQSLVGERYRSGNLSQKDFIWACWNCEERRGRGHGEERREEERGEREREGEGIRKSG